MLRDYQTDICSRVREAFGRHRSVMVQMPTGTGKTVVLASLVSQLGMTNVLVVAHRRELVGQIRETVRRMGLNGGSKGLKGEKEKSLKSGFAIVVESIQTISRRLATLDITPSLVVIDEAHHALAKTYRMMWEAWPEARFLGLTATPCRLDGKGFTDLFDILVQSWDIPTFIKEKWLATYDFVSIKADSHTQQLIGTLKKRGADGDYQVKEMDAVLNRRPSIERLYKCVMEYAHDRKGFVYAVSIDHARSIAAYYRSRGINAVAIDSRTPAKERADLLERFRGGTARRGAGGLQVLVNVDIFSEGFDCPDVEFIQLARPTLSLAKYLQMVGRGLRPGKGKKSCMIIDNVGLYRVFGLPSRIWDWQSAFEGRLRLKEDVRLRMKDRGPGAGDRENPPASLLPHRIEGSPSSFILHQDTGSEMYLVVSHEQLDATFERQKKDDLAARERMRLLGGVYGRVTTVGRQLVELRDTRGGLPTYVDLCNMNWFRHWRDGKPGVVRIGGIDFLRFGREIVSRTRTPITLSYDRERIRKFSYYTTHFSVDHNNADCMYFYVSGYQHGSNCVVFLHDDPLEYYWQSSSLWDGGLVVMDTDGCYYHVDKGMPKVYLGCADTEEDRDRLARTVHALIEESIRRDRERREDFRRNVESLEYVRPYQAGMKWGLRGSDGRILALPKYRSIREQNDYFLVEGMPLHWGVMDRFGKVLVEPEHDKVEVTPDGKAIMTSITGRQTIVDLLKI